MRRLANFSQNNKRVGWQNTLKLINGEVGINGEAGKSTAIRNFIEIKSSNDLVKISTKKHKKYKDSLSHEESLVLLLDSPLHASLYFIAIIFDESVIIFDESEGKFFAILNRKNYSQYGKIHATQKNA